MRSFVTRLALAATALSPLACGGGGGPGERNGPAGPTGGFPYPVGRITLPSLPVDLDSIGARRTRPLARGSSEPLESLASAVGASHYL